MINNANNSMFAIMLETEAGSGEYQESTSSTWPGEGYIFNENLSTCENGSELSWNEELGAVNLKTNIADKCFVYFDVYVLPEILEVTASDITSNSITLTVNAIAGTSNISTYYYSIDNGNSWVSSTSNSYFFTNLDYETEYIFSIYVEDKLNYKSKNYSLSESTTNPLIILSARVVGGNESPLYIESVTLNKDVEISKYIFDNTYELDSLYQEITPWECVIGPQSYSLYVISTDGEISEIYYGTWDAGNARCPVDIVMPDL